MSTSKLRYPFNQISVNLYSDITDLFYSGTQLKDEEIYSAISRGQIFSKQWMVQELITHLPDNAHVVVFGSWIGLAARLLFEAASEKIAFMTCVELDDRMERPSYHLNKMYGDRFMFINSDVFQLDLEEMLYNVKMEDRVFINCSCDNIDSTERYVDEIAILAGVNVLQQNNYKNKKSHLSVESIEDFDRQTKNLKGIVFRDTMNFNMYDRYMIISKQ